MPEKMSISVNGQSQVPPGFRFHPTEEELLQYYLRKKISCEKIDLDVIHDVDLNKLEPWDIQEKCKIGSTPQNDWYFFSHKDKKYPTGTRTNRATAAGFWKATGRDKVIYSNCRRIGMRKTLVFYKGRAPRGHKSDWIMHEYRLDDNLTLSDTTANIIVSDATGEATQEEGWVVCRIFMKKLHHKTLDNSSNSGVDTRTHSHRLSSSCTDQGTLEQIFQDMARTCKKQDGSVGILNGLHDRIVVKLPSLEEENPNFVMSSPPAACNNYQQIQLQMLMTDSEAEASMTNSSSPAIVYHQSETGLSDWSALDQIVASHLSGQSCDTSKQLPCLNNLPNMGFCSSFNRPFNNGGSQDDNGDVGLWSFTKSSLSSVADPLCHISSSTSPL